MTTPVNIKDAFTDQAALVSPNGELRTAPLKYSEVFQAVSSTTGIVNVVLAKPNMHFIINSTIIAQDKTNTDVDITLFEADDIDGVSTRVLFSGATTRSDRIIVPFLNVQTNKTKWINFQHDSATATISVTITGYYVDA